MSSEKPRLYTIHAAHAFLESVARGVMEKTAQDPLARADYLIIVPDRATAMALRQAFTALSGSGAAVLPKIESVSDLDIDTLGLKISTDRFLSQALMDMPPPVSRLERQLVLAREIMKIDGMASSVQKAVKLGGELGRFLDEVQRNEVDLSAIDTIVPDRFDRNWQKTSAFLKILTEAWPQYLQKIGAIDPEDHTAAILRVRALHWQKNPPQNPVLAVGFSSASPSLVALLKAITDASQGALVIQGLDKNIDQKSWQALGPTHPDAALRKLLSDLGVDKDDVSFWPVTVERTAQPRAVDPETTGRARRRLLREAMRPAATSEIWSELSVDPQALNGVDLITCGSAQEEASVIALKMREALEIPGRTATLVTPDRSLARRVSARLRHWKIDVGDQAGTSLAETPVGIFLYATANMAAEDWAPVPFLEAMKHPLTALGQKPELFRKTLASVEDLVFHGARPMGGAQGLESALSTAFNRASRRKTADVLAADKETLLDLVHKIQTAGEDFFSKMTSVQPQDFGTLLDAHIRFCEALAADGTVPGADRLWRDDDGVQGSRFLSRLRQVASTMPPVTGRDYTAVLSGLMRDVNVKPTAAPHPVLKILTPEQAMNDKSDIVIVGGLNSEVWPRRIEANPWLSPDMMAKLGLPRPEQEVGRDARFFVHAMSAPNVLMTRAVRASGAPSVSSPFLTRLQMVLKGAGLGRVLEGKSQLLDIHTAMHTPAIVSPIAPPEPRPAQKLRPKKLPVTAIEGLMRDPYSVYAKYVLKIKPRAAIDAAPNMADRGIFTHAALDTFMRRYPQDMPENAREELLKIGAETFKTHLDNPTVQAFWWPRFERVADWFVRFETERRELSQTLGTEVHGKLEIDLDGDVFTLTTIADRIDRDSQDRLEIIDYKTGTVPPQKAVSQGYSPQLTLEALIAFTGGFDRIDAGDVGKMQYWKLSGGRPAGEVIEIKGDVRQLVDEARTGVTNLMRIFNDPKTPYLSTPRPDEAPRYNNYEHLSRIGEWATVKAIAEKNAPAKKAGRKTTRRASPRAKTKKSKSPKV